MDNDITPRSRFDLYEEAYTRQQKSFIRLLIPPFLYIIISEIILYKIPIKHWIDFIIIAFGILVIADIMWYLFSWIVNLTTKFFDPQGTIEGAKEFWDRAENESPLNKTKRADLEKRFVEKLKYFLRREIIKSIVKILIVFMLIVLVFGCIFHSADRFFCSNSYFNTISERGPCWKYYYYSLTTFTIAGNISPIGIDPWRYLLAAFEIIIWVVFAIISITLIFSCIFLFYSVFKDDFSTHLDSLLTEAEPKETDYMEWYTKT